MSDLVEFLLVCIADDEAVAREADEHERLMLGDLHAGWYAADVPYEGIQIMSSEIDPGYETATTRHITRWSPARVLAECEAKRQIVTECDGYMGDDLAPWLVLRHLAVPYADRPGFREEWRP